ncbi:MAG TPA: hypothetical protein PLX65_14860, partial [Accumulibacter sp.]|nr:hypothetical protein [Accumulibacter sp.]
DETRHSRELYDELLAIMHEKHYQQYRAGLQSWRDLFANAPELQRLHDSIKAAIDPANILSPGHYGIAYPRLTNDGKASPAPVTK